MGTNMPTDEELQQAQLVLDGAHPDFDYEDVETRFGLDPSFIYTAVTLAPYVAAYVKENSNG